MWFLNDTGQRERMVDIILMVALADGFIETETRDRIARTIDTYAEFEGIEWEWVIERSEELALDAPLFSDTRKLLVDKLSDARSRRLGISLAAKIVGAGRELAEEERAILATLAESFLIPDEELAGLLQPWSTDDLSSYEYRRSTFNDPNAENPPSLFDVIAKAPEDEVRLLLYKLCATRRVLDTLDVEYVVAGVGESIRVGPYHYRADAIADLPETGARLVMRFLADGEALYPTEQRILSTLQARLSEGSCVIIGHQGSLAAPDETFFKGLDQTKLRIQKIEI